MKSVIYTVGMILIILPVINLLLYFFKTYQFSLHYLINFVQNVIEIPF